MATAGYAASAMSSDSPGVLESLAADGEFDALRAVPGLAKNLELLSERDIALAKLLVKEGQRKLFSAWADPGTDDTQKLTFFEQAHKLDSNYPGGLGCYIRNARELLQDAASGKNPLDGWTPSVPKEGFHPEVGSKEFFEYEALGLKEIGGCCFVIPAGGLGERLGFSGVKFALPAELTTGCCVLAVYAAYLRAFEGLAETASGQPCRLPLVIMASADTEAGITALLESNDYFGLQHSQVTVLLQEKVAALANSDALLATESPYCIATKPHGHGDVHFLLHSKGLVKRWLEEGRRWVLFFQDTNTLYLMTFLCSLGVSVRHRLQVNSVAMPRKAKEAVGSITQLTHTDGRSIVVNVEYNQLEPLLKATVQPEGDVNGPDGLSPFPGNTNELIFSLPEYAAELGRNGGQMPEFINPKYADASRTAFKSPTRLECMMQDFPKVLPPEARVGFTRYPLEFGYFPCKNDIATAARLAKEGTPPHGAASAEAAVYHAYCTMLSLLGAVIAPQEERLWRGGPQLTGPAVVLWPDFAPCLRELQRKLGRPEALHVAAGSSLEVRGSNVRIDELDLQGAVRILAAPGTSLHIEKLRVRNKGHEFVALTEAEQAGGAAEELCIRGYRVVEHETEVIEVHAPGSYVYSDGELKKIS
eukprot:TRINITY_DN50387_c0_g1_i1.p1 TRINITY_DN50387_c0_g1~~TRINITY_DN50387_c0_g1_i1.p1  ORF type:complete len:646 (-),score=132.93 TRINITY_DN50387_c0_g1_i1:128-2065(-)